MRFNLNPSQRAPFTVNARPLPQRDSNGYGGFGYDGDHLYLAWVEDRFDPAVYAIRADDLYTAYEVAEASLAPLLTPEDIAAIPPEEVGVSGHCTYSATGDVVDTEALKLYQVR